MAEATLEQMAALAPYVAGAVPDGRGEIEVYCPMHADSRRSASVNVEMGVWYCHAGCGGGSLRQLLDNQAAWVSTDERTIVTMGASAPSTAQSEHATLPTLQDVLHWHRRLRREAPLREQLEGLRGVSEYTMRKALVGWNGREYTIPVFSPKRRLWNVRKYTMDPRPGWSKIWNTRGMGQARLYPMGVLNRLELGDAVLFCEGEWDTLLANQHGIPAVTRTDGAGKPWHDPWTDWFVGLRVFVCSDMDLAGADADATVSDALLEVADVYQCHLPFERTKSSGKDLSDYLLEVGPNRRTELLGRLLASATPKE